MPPETNYVDDDYFEDDYVELFPRRPRIIRLFADNVGSSPSAFRRRHRYTASRDRYNLEGT